MKIAVTMVCTLLAAGVSVAQVVNFDKDKTGVPPADWTCGVTGSGKPRWTVEADSGAPSAPSAPNVLMQSGAGDFPWCVRTGTAIQDGFVEVKFKPTRGREDQAGGVVLRWKDGNNCCVARANALENNVCPYYTEGGSHRTLTHVDAAGGQQRLARLACRVQGHRHARAAWWQGRDRIRGCAHRWSRGGRRLDQG